MKRREFIKLLGGVGHGRARSNSRAGTMRCASSSTSSASATRSMATARRDAALVEVAHCHGLTRSASYLPTKAPQPPTGEA
jgi:hypothetical protein